MEVCGKVFRSSFLKSSNKISSASKNKTHSVWGVWFRRNQFRFLGYFPSQLKSKISAPHSLANCLVPSVLPESIKTTLVDKFLPIAFKQSGRFDASFFTGMAIVKSKINYSIFLNDKTIDFHKYGILPAPLNSSISNPLSTNNLLIVFFDQNLIWPPHLFG